MQDGHLHAQSSSVSDESEMETGGATPWGIRYTEIPVIDNEIMETQVMTTPWEENGENNTSTWMK